jgi:hypothetical protein
MLTRQHNGQLHRHCGWKKTNKQTNRRKTIAKPVPKKRMKSMSLECNSNNNNSTETDGRRHSVDDEAELLQDDEISKTIVIT